MMKNLTKIIALILITISFIEPIKAQTTKKTDLILLVDKSEINGIIEEISETEIKYKKAENPSGPVYTIKKSGVYMIIYSNGEREKISELVTSKPSSTTTQSSSSAVMNVPAKPSNSGSSKIAEKKPKETPKPKEVEKEQPTVSSETATEGNDDFFENRFGFLDIGTNLNTLGKQGAPITIVLNVHNNGLTKKVSKYLFLGLYSTISFQSSDGGGGIPSSSFLSTLYSVGGRYYLNDLLKLDANKYQLYGGVTLLNFQSVSQTVNNQYTSNSNLSFQFVGRIGGRYSFSKFFGVFAELGFANGGTTIDAGLSLSTKRKK
jgi:hypothetical protein